MRLKIVGYYGDDKLVPKHEFECITDRHEDFVSVSAFKLLDAAGIPRGYSAEQARSLVGREFDVGSLIPYSYLIRGEPKPATDERWKDLGESMRCDYCGRRFCDCGEQSRPVAA